MADENDDPIDEEPEPRIQVAGGAVQNLPKQLGKYTLGRLLGTGGMGCVWQSEHPDLHIPVAIKTVQGDSDTFTQRFLVEARSAALINHTSVARTYDAGSADDVQYIVMEYLPGGSVADKVKEGALSLEDSLYIGEAVAAGLVAAGEVDIIHRDIKPDNIMLDGKGEPKLVDLGLAKKVGVDSNLTVEGAMLGTPAYIAPEQAQGDAAVDTRADIYSLGATLFHLITGKRPYEGDNAIQVSLAHVTKPVPDPRKLCKVPDSVAELLMKMMAKDPAERHQTPAELLIAIRSIQIALGFRSGSFADGAGLHLAGAGASANQSATLIAVVAVVVAALVIINPFSGTDGDDPALPQHRTAVAGPGTSGAGPEQHVQPGTPVDPPDATEPAVDPGPALVDNTSDPVPDPVRPPAGTQDPVAPPPAQPVQTTPAQPVQTTPAQPAKPIEVAALPTQEPVKPPVVPPPPAKVLPAYLVIDLSDGPEALVYPIERLKTIPDDLMKKRGNWRTSKILLRRVTAGTFSMGSPADEAGRELIGNKETAHAVTLSKDYYVGVFEVTQAQWDLVMGGHNPSFYPGDEKPVEQVSYHDICGSEVGALFPALDRVDDESFIGRLRERTDLHVNLPTEAQWEYACRAGTSTAYSFGGDPAKLHQFANFRDKTSFFEVGDKWFQKTDEEHSDGHQETAQVGSLAPNPWGLYDMHGNVWEWCRDWFVMDLGKQAATDPLGGTSGSIRSIRGGCWRTVAEYCRSSARRRYGPEFGYDHVGFRIVVMAED